VVAYEQRTSDFQLAQRTGERGPDSSSELDLGEIEDRAHAALPRIRSSTSVVKFWRRGCPLNLCASTSPPCINPHRRWRPLCERRSRWNEVSAVDGCQGGQAPGNALGLLSCCHASGCGSVLASAVASLPEGRDLTEEVAASFVESHAGIMGTWHTPRRSSRRTRC
jgi:hypothetical protein